jgi:hypothetical protein
MRVDGNLRTAFSAMHLVLEQGYELRIGMLHTGYVSVTAEDPNTKTTGRKQRTGYGQTMADAMAELTKKMGIKLPGQDG